MFPLFNFNIYIIITPLTFSYQTMDYIHPDDKNIFWDSFLKTIEESVNVHSFNTWFKPMQLIDLTDHNILVSVPKAYFSSWLEEHYMPLLKSASSSLLGRELIFSFMIPN